MNDPFIQEFKNAIPDMCCDEIMQMYELENNRYDGTVLAGVLKDVKDTRDFIIPHNDPKWKNIEMCITTELQNCLSKYIKKIKEDAYPSYDYDGMYVKNLMIQKYQKMHGRYTMHDDFNEEDDGYRVITFLVYLNNVEDGGETSFYGGKYKIKPEKGKIMFFPAEWSYPHEGIMPVSSDKYIITNWFYMKRFKGKY